MGIPGTTTIGFDITKYLSMSTMKKTIYNSYAQSSESIMGTVADTLRMQDADLTIVLEVWNLLAPLAYGLVVIYFLVELIEKSTNLGHGQLDEKFMISSLFKLIIAGWLLDKGPDLIALLLSLVNSVLDLAVQTNITAAIAADVVDTNNAKVNDALLVGIYKLGMLDCIALMPNALVSMACNAIASLSLQFQAVAKKLELILYGCFSGVAMASVFGEANRQVAVRYLKKFLGCVLHAMAIILVIKISDALNSYSLIEHISDGSIDLATVPVVNIIKTVLYKFAAIGSISVAKTIINDALS